MARQIQTSKRQVPIEQIIAVKGRNPYAAPVTNFGEVLGEALLRKEQLRREGQQLARFEESYGLKPGELSGIQDSSTALKIAQDVSSSRKPTYVQQINPDGSATVLEVPAGGKFGGVVRTPTPPTPAKKQNVGTTPEGDPVSYDPLTGKFFVDTSGYSGMTLPKTIGTEEQRRVSLVSGADKSINDIKNIVSTNPSALTELKAIRLTPGRVYAQLASSDAKRLYINLREAISNEIYLKTGATANEQELENATISYLAALNDNPQDFITRMDLLQRNISPFNMRKNALPTLDSPQPVAIPALTGKKKIVAEKLGLNK